ncbi:hypothetical protein B0O99DRAFT_618987 [Bisporella sp. PMI_857]|nr:hypothetical protein B0O99DRAFT_618987 [Bisporella sp. PMI_857]
MHLNHLLSSGLLSMCLLRLPRANAHLTYASIRNLTSLTSEAHDRVRIPDLGFWSAVGDGQQVELGGRDEVEIVVTAALRTLCSGLLGELEMAPPSGDEPKSPPCSTVLREYHDFLNSTVHFLAAVRDAQLRYQWRGGDTPVFDAVMWLQSLWASRASNKQSSSFIEQQMQLYKYRQQESCFGDSNEVLKHGVEIVEFLNDLGDEF